jgi:hypothetical protein
VDISRIFILVEFGRILRLVESGGFLRYRVDNNRFPRFRFRVRAVYYKAFLLITRGSK